MITTKLRFLGGQRTPGQIIGIVKLWSETSTSNNVRGEHQYHEIFYSAGLCSVGGVG